MLHRGAPRDQRIIAGSRIIAVRSAGIELSPEVEGSDTIFVPYHRFLAILGPDGDELWSKEAGTRPEPEPEVGVLENIRARRKKPGLMRQHLTAVQAAALVCGAVVDGASLGSTRIVFRPGPIVGGDRVIDIGSAGSIMLVLQTLALPLTFAKAASRTRFAAAPMLRRRRPTRSSNTRGFLWSAAWAHNSRSSSSRRVSTQPAAARP